MINIKAIYREIDTPWGISIFILVLCIFLTISMYYNTIFFMVHTWHNSNSYEHCFLIIPISIYMIWRRHDILGKIIPYSDYSALLVLGFLGFLWHIANISGVMVLQQYMVVAMIPVVVWTLLGRHVAIEIGFPLIYLFFVVPFGDFLIPGLMSFTADFAIALLKITGIPVFRDGLYFSIPSGDWSVVEACSGIRYLIASLTLGSLFAYINYSSYLKRTIFIVLSLIVPIIANGIRAYLIVMIGHLSSMTLAVGVDHFIYGWIFFGIVMAVMFWVGSKWSDPEIIGTSPSVVAFSSEDWKKSRLFVAGAGAILVLFLWPMRSYQLEQSAAALPHLQYTLAQPQVELPWRQDVSFTDWSPRYIGADAEQQAFYTDGKSKIALFIRYYKHEGQGHELVTSENILTDKEKSLWRLPEEKFTSIIINGETCQVREARLISDHQQLLTWRWNWIAGHNTSNDWLAKLYQAYYKMIGKSIDQAGLIIAIEVNGSISESKQSLQEFLSSNLPAIEQSLSNVSSQGNQE